jgi:tripartite-type tricarboxylate transporter receptor subunit TctC
MRGFFTRVLLLLVTPVLAAGAVQAQDYPSKPIRVIVGAGAGGGLDVIARLIGPKLSDSLKQPVLIENKPGAGAMIATEYVARAQPDGHTLLLASPGAITVNPVVMPKVSYSPTKEFAPISMIASFPLVLVADPKLPIQSVADVVSYAKANPDKATTGGSGYAARLVHEMFRIRTGIPLEFVVYRSSGDTALAVIAGQLFMSIIDSPAVAAQIHSGLVRGIAVTTPKRVETLAQLPTMAEAGVPGMEVFFWAGLMAPAGTPAPIVQRLEAEVKKAVMQEDTRARLAALQAEPFGMSGADFGRFIESEIARWTEVARSGNIKVQ